MTIDISLSPESVARAVDLLKEAYGNFTSGVQQAVEVLAKDGAEEAKAAFGKMASVEPVSDSETEARIVATGEAVIIAEFGAGYATMEYHPFADKAPVPIEVASYSREQYPYGLFYISDQVNPGEGYWFFGGREYDRVQPRHGLLNAYDYLMQNAGEIVSEVIKL